MKYQLIDLIEDKSFVNWVQQTNKEDSLKWELYLQQNPQQRALAEEASFIVRGIPFAPKPVNPQHVEEQWQRLRQRLVEQSSDLPPRPSPEILKNYRFALVTLVGMLLGIISYCFVKLN